MAKKLIIHQGINVRSGVLQGTILGPLLFLLYVHDLPDSVKATAKMFADDPTFYSNISALADLKLSKMIYTNLQFGQKLGY